MKTNKDKCHKTLFQEILSSYYLIPNIERFFDRIFELINKNYNFAASYVHFISLYNYKKKDSILKLPYSDTITANKNFSSLLKELIDKHSHIITERSLLTVSEDLEANILPIFYEEKKIAILIFLKNKDIAQVEDNNIDFLHKYLSAALIANFIISQNSSNNQQYQIDSIYSPDLSLKKICDWRLREVLEKFLDSTYNSESIFKEITSQTEKILIESALKKAENNKSMAAKLLGINRNTLCKKIKDFNF